LIHFYKRDMELYIKAGPDGESVGDCPFAHYVRAVLETKGLQYKVYPCTKETKPAWLLDDHQGKMPCLRDGSEIITESSVIVDYLEEKYPEPQVRGADDEEMFAATAGLFPAIAKFIKKAEHDPELEANLVAELGRLDVLLKTSKGPFLCGLNASMCDLSLGPKLYHLRTTINHFYPQSAEKVLSGTVADYIERLLSLPSINICSYPTQTVIAGWTAARQS